MKHKLKEKKIDKLPINQLPNKLIPDVLNKILRNLHFCSFVLFLSFIKKTDASMDLTIFIISLIFSFETISVVWPYPNLFFWIAVSVTNAAAVTKNGCQLKTYFIKGNPIVSNGPKSLSRNPPGYLFFIQLIILY